MIRTTLTYMVICSLLASQWLAAVACMHEDQTNHEIQRPHLHLASQDDHAGHCHHHGYGHHSHGDNAESDITYPVELTPGCPIDHDADAFFVEKQVAMRIGIVEYDHGPTILSPQVVVDAVVKLQPESESAISQAWSFWPSSVPLYARFETLLI